MLTPREALQQYFGFNQFREGQEEAIRRVLNGQQTLLVMPTGAGKSLAYQLPAVINSGLTLVISPLIALMKDQVDSLTEAGLSATYINSSLPLSEANERMRAVLEGHVKLLYVAPERLRNSRFMQSLARVNINLLAVDEAHCVSQWGHDFRPDYLRIAPTWQAMGCPTLLATTATATPDVQKQICRLLGVQNPGIIVAGFNRPNLSFKVKFTPDDNTRYETLKALLLKTEGNIIVYTSTRRNSEEVADFARHLGLSAQAYHAGLDANLRYQVQNDFMAGRLPVIVATNAFGMGVNKADVRAVIHYNMPGSVEAYYQEAGRAGRDGLPADCVMLFSPQDQRLQEWLIQSDTPTYEDMHQLYHLFAKVARDDQVQGTMRELVDATQMFPTKLRLTLSELEQAGLIIHIGMQGMFNQWQVRPFNQQALVDRDEAVQQRLVNRLTLLNHILNYAQLSTCRRKFLLDYFGDVTPPKSPRCCDNHLDDTLDDLSPATTPEEWYPLIVMETAHTLPRSVGRTLLAEILTGSRSQRVTRYDYNRHKFFGKLSNRLSQKQVVTLIDTLIRAKYVHLTGGDRPVVEVTPLGLKALERRLALPIRLPTWDEAPAQTNRPRRSDTMLETLDLVRQGLSPAEMATERGLTEQTIYGHLRKLIAQGKIALNDIVPSDIEQQIVEAISIAGSIKPLSPLKALLPDEITYEQIRCVIAAHPEPPAPPPTLPSKADPVRRVVALGREGDPCHVPELITALQHDEGNVRRLAASALGKIGDPAAVDPLLDLLNHEPLPQVRQYAINALGKIGDHRARHTLELIADNDNGIDYITRAARAALIQLANSS